MSTVLSDAQFDIAFSEWERHRMYPHYYRKGTDMESPKQKHIYALIRAQNMLEYDVDVSYRPHLKKRIRRDIQLLTEIREMLLVIIENPTLPFDTDTSIPEVPILDQIEAESDGAF